MITQPKKVYLDTKDLIDLVECPNQSHSKLLSLINNGEIIPVLSFVHIEELCNIRPDNASQQRKLASHVDSWLTCLYIFSPGWLPMWEVAKFLHTDTKPINVLKPDLTSALKVFLDNVAEVKTDICNTVSQFGCKWDVWLALLEWVFGTKGLYETLKRNLEFRAKTNSPDIFFLGYAENVESNRKKCSSGVTREDLRKRMATDICDSCSAETIPRPTMSPKEIDEVIKTCPSWKLGHEIQSLLVKESKTINDSDAADFYHSLAIPYVDAFMGDRSFVAFLRKTNYVKTENPNIFSDVKELVSWAS